MNRLAKTLACSGTLLASAWCLRAQVPVSLPSPGCSSPTYQVTATDTPSGGSSTTSAFPGPATTFIHLALHQKLPAGTPPACGTLHLRAMGDDTAALQALQQAIACGDDVAVQVQFEALPVVVTTLPTDPQAQVYLDQLTKLDFHVCHPGDADFIDADANPRETIDLTYTTCTIDPANASLRRKALVNPANPPSPANPASPAAPTAPSDSWTVAIAFDAATLNCVDFTSQVFASPTTFPDMAKGQAPWNLADLLANADGKVRKVPKSGAITFERYWDGEGPLGTLVGAAIDPTLTSVAITSNDPCAPSAAITLADVQVTDWWLFSEDGITRERTGFTCDTRVVRAVAPPARTSAPK